MTYACFALGVNAEQVTFEHLREAVLDQASADELRSVERIERALAKLGRRFKNVPALWISERVPAYIAHRRAKGAANATIKYELAILRRAFRIAVRRKLLAYRPEFDLPKVSNTRTNEITEDVLQAIMAKLPEYHRPVIEFAYLTGWRKSEVTGLTWDRVDWKNGMIRLAPGTTKNGEGRKFPFRTLPRLDALLRARKAATATWELAHPGEKVERVFWRPEGDETKPIGDFHETWRRACRNAGHPDAWFHDSRRAAIRNFDRAGISRDRAMQLSGHETDSMYERYNIGNEKDLEDAVAKLDKIVGGAH